MPFPALLRIPFTGSETRQKRQRPSASRPGHRSQQHQAHPSQTAGLDKMRMGTARRIAVNPFGLDSFAPAALNRIVDAQDNRTGGHKPSDKQTDEDATGLTATPASTTQHTMVVDKTVLTTQPDNAQTTRHGALSRSQHRAY